MDSGTPLLIIYFLSVLLIFLGFVIHKSRHTVHDLREQLRHDRTQLYGKAKFAELGAITAGATHEINNALTLILGRITLLQRIYKDPAKQEKLAQGLEQLVESTERISQTVKSIREYIYMDSDKVLEESRLQNIIDEALILVGQRLKNHGIDFRTSNIGDIRVYGCKIHLKQALLNLINNSLDAIDKLPEKWIEISAVDNLETVSIFVKDSGPGIPFEVQSKMMDPFYSTKKSKGTGLGLTFVKSVVDEHHGKFAYVDYLGKTSFMIELPHSF